MTTHPWTTLLSALITSLALLAPASATAQTQDNAQAKQTAEQKQTTAYQQATEVERESWRKTILHTRRPRRGCFIATFPETEWREVECIPTPPTKPYPPRRVGGLRLPNTVGGSGPDFSAIPNSGHISEGEGSFDSVSGVTSESNTAGTANIYSLQLNTDFFHTTNCSTYANCRGWEQFIYQSSGRAYIQYWFIKYGTAGTACPNVSPSCDGSHVFSNGWCPFNVAGTTDVYCARNASSSISPTAEPATSLGILKLTGTAAGFNGNADDEISVSAGSVLSAPGNNYFTDLGSQWGEAEFNVFGDGGNDAANFNTGSTIVVRTSVGSGTALAPSCDQASFTGESNNLTLVQLMPPVAHTGIPSVVFKESNVAGSTQTTCAGAVTVGDTHITTFDGLYYDFQASGDFVLAQDGHDFIVQARQASGAPTWPNAAVNKAIATQMGKTRVALYIEPTRLVVDGVATDLADGKSTLLPTGVQISRQGNVYTISSESGDQVRATLNSTWIDAAVGLGFSPRANVRGLLGNPLGNAQELVTATGVVLKAPVLFQDLYRTYAESWRVPPRESLFTGETRFGIPAKAFYASDLTRGQAAHAREVCKAAGITNRTFLDSCILDTTVLHDDTAVKVFVDLPLPRHVIKPGAKGKDNDCDCDDRDHDHDKDRDQDRDHKRD
jgi:type II secretory pathway pseudopilin PulG